MDNKKLKIDYKQLTPEQLSQLEQYNNAKAQLTKLEDIADMTHELINIFDEFVESGGKTSNNYGALLMDMRDSLKALNNKEEPESPDFAKPVVSAVKALEQTLGLAIKGISIEAPQVSVSSPSIDLKGVEKAVAEIPKAFAQAIKLIPKVEIPKTDNSALLKVWEEISTQLQSIDNATRMKPQPGKMNVTNPDGTYIGSSYIEPPSYTSILDDSADPILYIGKATIGSATSSSVWQIAKLDTSSGLIKTWADNAGFTQVWDDRTSITYS